MIHWIYDEYKDKKTKIKTHQFRQSMKEQVNLVLQ